MKMSWMLVVVRLMIVLKQENPLERSAWPEVGLLSGTLWRI